MKKLFTILTVVVLTTTASFGQFSVKAGLNMANMVSNDDDSENGMKLGMIIGGSYAMELSDAMSLDVSVAFKQSGTKETDEETSGGVTIKASQTVALNYLDISPSLSFNVSDAFSLSVGPYLAFAMSGNIKWEMSAKGNGVDESESDSEAIDFGDGDDDDGIKAMDFGINIGAAYNITDAINVSAGYSLGLSNLIYIDDDMKDFFDAMDEDLPSLKNSGIFLTFGYTFGG